jgi:glycosyltransferase involved in cell wall biosynthesis
MAELLTPKLAVDPQRHNLAPQSSCKESPVPVLLTVRELNLGGIERDATKIALSLDRRRFQVHVATYFPYGVRYEELRSNGIPVLHLPSKSLLSRTTIEAAFRLRRYIQQREIRIVHAWDNSSVLTVPVARTCGVPVVITSVLGNRSLVRGRTVKLLRLVDWMSDAVVVNCRALLRHLAEDEGVPREKVHLCYNGVNTQEFSPGKRDVPELPNASLVVGTVAVLRPVKALDVLQQAFAQVRCIQEGMTLVIVGRGPELSRLQENSQRLGIQDSCLFITSTDEVPRWLRAMDIFVSSSYSEGLSNAILEAMACGCATIGTRVGGTPELLGEDQRGLLCRPGDPRDLATKMQLLVTNPYLRNTLKSRAIEFAQLEMSMEKATRSLSNIYSSLLEKHKTKMGLRYR